MPARCNRLGGIRPQESGIGLEPEHVSRTTVLCVPVARDLSGIRFVQHGVEEGLVRETSGERPPSALAYQLELTLSCRAEERDRILGHPAFGFSSLQRILVSIPSSDISPSWRTHLFGDGWWMRLP